MRCMRSSTFARGMAALVSITTILQFAPADGSPSEIMSSPAPVIESDAPRARDLRDGDASVATSTGALNYSYPIQVPPGRNGMVPHLALTYSSQAPIYGGIAAGWSLVIPQILENTSQGRLRTHAPEVDVSQSDPAADDRFVSTLAGGRRLIRVTEPSPAGAYATYRADGDPTFARYVRMVGSSGHRWRVYLPDGTTMYFGGMSQTIGCPTYDGFAPLTSVVDAFGNEVRYDYESVVAGECRIKRISWGQNFSPGANIGEFAEVVFTWGTQTPCLSMYPGAQRSYATGRLVVTGASKLTAITVNAFPPGAPATPDHTRLITLSYDTSAESCSALYSPHRRLASIQESAWGTNAPRVDLPPVEFTYGSSLPTLDTDRTGGIPWGASLPRPNNLGWGYRYKDDRWPTVEAMLVDVDGDGLLDRVFNSSAPGFDGSCSASWQRNRGPVAGSGTTTPQFENPRILMSLPKLRWYGGVSPSPTSNPTHAETASPYYEGCALNGQVTAFTNSVNASFCHDGSACFSDSDSNYYCGAAKTECPTAGNLPGPYRTYLAYRWVDVDGDGLVDLVAAVHGNINRYDIEQGNTVPFLGHSEPPLFGAWPTCPSQADRCADISSTCETQARTCPAGQLCTFNWSAMNNCMAIARKTGCEGLIKDSGAQGSRAPYTRCGGLYPWFIYKNQGNGTFATTPVIKYQPVPLESDVGDSNIAGPGIMAGHHGIMDIDGDGVPDALVGPRVFNSNNPILWSVWLGDGTGGFGLKRYEFPTHDAPFNHISAIGGTVNVLNKQSEGLLDLNGDGLADHWIVDLNGNVNIAFNDGVQHRLLGPPTPVGEVTTPLASKPGSDAAVTVTTIDSNFVVAGEQNTTRRTLDLDWDGRPDVLDGVNTTASSLYVNLGGQLDTSQPYGIAPFGFRRRVAVSWENNSAGPFYWDLFGDVIDLDGDGLTESASFSGTTFTRRERGPQAPPRLLTTIDNHRGAITTVTYTSMHDADVVVQHPGTVVNENGDFRPKASPNNQWVVKSVSTADQLAGTTSTMTYKYTDPRNGKDDEGHYAFRGFEEVQTTAASGAKTIERFAYSPDWSGRLVTLLVMPAEFPSEVRSMSRTTWEERDLFGGTVKNFFPTIVEHFICANGQSEAQCAVAGAAPGYSKTTSTLTALASTTVPGGPALLWVDTESLLQSATSAADGDRRALSSFVLASDAATYRLRQVGAQGDVRLGGTFTLFRKMAKTWDATFRVPLTDEVWFDSNDANRAIARAEYDMATGLVTKRYKPKQNAANTTFTQFSYDARKLLVAIEINEVGLEFDYTYEYGTGTVLMIEGPNVRSCTQNCPNDATHPVKEQHKIRVDGLGREIERWDTTSDDGAIYALYQMTATTYVDAAVGTPLVPTSVTQQTRLDITGPWKQVKTEFDGHGRPKRRIVYVQGTAPADQITTFSYRNDGTLSSVAVPDPTQNNASTVSYAYTFDSLGRATSIRRPDSSLATDKSGVDISYDGTTKTVSEIVKAGDGQPAVTRMMTDKLGRLVQVRERVQQTSLDLDSTWAITNYSYGPDDLIATVTDPQNVMTTLVHDFAGHRTEIRRPNNRTWSYGYDKNGNVISERVPGSPDPTQDAKYTTTIAYDDLDRPTSKVIGQRDLSDADQQLFGDYTESFTWDYGPNRKGYLRYWKARGPAATTDSVLLNLSNDNQGNRTSTQQVLNIAGYPEIVRGFYRDYYLFGGARLTRYRDTVPDGIHDPTNQSDAQIYYDARGLPQRIVLTRTGEANQSIAQQTRNVAALVTKRRTDVSTAMGYVESNWAYDVLGRVANQVVQKGPGTTQVVRQGLAYSGNDDPKTLDHYLGVTQRHLQYGYDLRHQLTSATETTTPGYFSATYNYGLAGRFTHALEAQTSPAPPRSDVKPRDVNYQYAGTDPEEVTALTNVSNGQPFATYTYDATGNQKTRCYGPVTQPSCTGELTEYVYDGKDQLRRATKKVNGVVQGSEEYWYDNDGQRIAIVKRDAAGNKTELVNFNHDTEAHYDGVGNIVHVYSHLTLGTPVARVDRTSPIATNVEYQFHGLANNTIAAVDQGGTINSSFSYTPFGEIVEATDGGGVQAGILAHKRRINDKVQDDISALHYYGARYFDPTLVGWSTRDPIFSRAPDIALLSTPRRANLFAFSLNNPLRYLDPDGRDPEPMRVPIIDPSEEPYPIDMFYCPLFSECGWMPPGINPKIATDADINFGLGISTPAFTKRPSALQAYLATANDYIDPFYPAKLLSFIPLVASGGLALEGLLLAGGELATSAGAAEAAEAGLEAGSTTSRLVMGGGSLSRFSAVARAGDVTLDINPAVAPDIVADYTQPLTSIPGAPYDEVLFERVPSFTLTPQAATNAYNALASGGGVEVLTSGGLDAAITTQSVVDTFEGAGFSCSSGGCQFAGLIRVTGVK